MKWCVNCSSYQKAWSEVCKSHCGNRCYNCNRLFSGEVVRGEYERNINSSITAAMRHADSKGVTLQIQIRPNETNIYYHGKK